RNMDQDRQPQTWTHNQSYRRGIDPCRIDDCERTIYSREVCKRHYNWFWRNGWDKPYEPTHWGKWRNVKCSEDECSRLVSAKGLCESHYNAKRWADGHGRQTPEETRRAHLKYRYGIEPEDYDRMLEQQDGRCAICQREPDHQNTRGRGVLFIDHCHNSNAIRGLLCNDCNLIIGHGATVARLKNAIEYLRAND